MHKQKEMLEESPYQPPRYSRKPRRKEALRVTFVVLLAIILLVRASSWPAEGALIGSAEAVVRGRYGHPTQEFAGYYGNPPLTWTRQFTGEIKSGIFQRLGGEVYVSFEQRDGQWIVISNSYLPHGAAF